MTRFAVSLTTRTGAAGQLGAVFFLALGLFVACGNDVPEFPDTGGAGKSGSANNSGKAGKGGEAGEEESAGSGSAGEGDAGAKESGGTGGVSGAGGTISGGGTSGAGGSVSGGGMGGKGGTGGGGPKCGNNVLDSGEACDDGNTVFGDSCSPTCTNVCEKCEKDVCEAGGDYSVCDNAWTGDATATAGPKAGTKKTVLCNSLVACLKRTGCAQYDDTKVVANCYCGTASAVECAEAGKPNGACMEEIAAAGEERKFAVLAQRQSTQAYALGVATVVHAICNGGYCANECVLGKSNTECQKCAAKTPEYFAPCYVNPKKDPSLSAELCSAVLECAHRTRCAINGVTSCYGSATEPTGPCAGELTAASKGMTPLQIMSQLQSPSADGPLAAAATEIMQELSSCSNVCFPPASGGTGGGGGGTSGSGG